MTEPLPWMTSHEVYTMIGIAAVATMAGVFRVWRNGQWKGLSHCVGVVGCSTIASGFTVSFAMSRSDSLRTNMPCVLWLAGAVALLSGKMLYEVIIPKLLGNIVSIAGSAMSQRREGNPGKGDDTPT